MSEVNLVAARTRRNLRHQRETCVLTSVTGLFPKCLLDSFSQRLKLILRVVCVSEGDDHVFAGNRRLRYQYLPNVRDHLIYSLALGTGLRLAEVVGRDVGDVFAPDGTPRVRVRVRAAIAKGGRAADLFLPDRLVTKLKRFRRWKRERGEDMQTSLRRLGC